VTDLLMLATVIAAAVLVIVSAFMGPVYFDDNLWRAHSEIRRIRREALRAMYDVEQNVGQDSGDVIDGTATDISKKPRT
jgi:uncharacterized protein (DUF2164 family)